jgi:hypothetical protein
MRSINLFKSVYIIEKAGLFQGLLNCGILYCHSWKNLNCLMNTLGGPTRYLRGGTFPWCQLNESNIIIVSPELNNFLYYTLWLAYFSFTWFELSSAWNTLHLSIDLTFPYLCSYLLILLYSFPSKHNDVRNSLKFTVYNEVVCLDCIATYFGLWSRH